MGVKKVIDKVLENIFGSWDGYKGSRVREAIQKALKEDDELIQKLEDNKVGYLAEIDSTDSNFVVIGAFASEDSYNKWKDDKDNQGDLLLFSFNVTKASASGETTSYIVKLVNMGEKSLTATKKSDLVAKIRFTSQTYNPADKSLTDNNENATLTIQTRMQGASEWTDAGKMTIASQSSESTDTYTSIDLAPYINDGTQSVRFIAVGEMSEKKTQYVLLTVTLTNISIKFNVKWQNPFEYKDVNPDISLPVYVSGNIDKTLHYKVTCEADASYSKTYDFSLGTAIYPETPYTGASIQHPKKQGVYTIEAWVTSGDSVRTESVFLYIMCTMAGDKTPLLVLNNIANLQNWSNVKAFDYAIYNPNAETTDVAFDFVRIEDGKSIYKETVTNVKNNDTPRTLQFNLEYETGDTANFPIKVTFQTQSGTTLRQDLRMVVDNSENFAPTSGYDFFLNPKARNNSETDKATVINAANGNKVKSTFEGLTFVSDGWIVDANTGVRCLRVLDGSKVSINYDAYSDDTPLQGLTIELDFAARNVTDETGHLFDMNTIMSVDGKPLGLWVMAQESCFLTSLKRTQEFQNWIYQKDKRTHVAVNIVPNLYGQGTNYVRVFINGIISREFTYSDEDRFWQAVDGIKRTGGIVINPQGADIDIYALRIYKKSMSATEIRQNYLSSFATVEEKKSFKEKNDILGDTGLINYKKAKEKYNTLLYMGKLPTLANGLKSTICDIVINKVGDKKHSGRLRNGKITRQGSTSRKYWGEGNLQMVSADETSAWIDADGNVHAWGYQNTDDVPIAVKLVDKRNWASSMQSHKMGATRMFNDLYKEVVKKNEITSMEGFENCRVAVYEEPFLVFQQTDEDSEPVFIGLGTFGSGKADKPTFGYDKQKSPNMLMIEGSDNNPRLTKHQTPWIDGDVVYSEDEEGFVYAGTTSWDYDMGNLDTISRFKEAFNFVYLHSNRLKPFLGTYTQLKAAASTLDVSYQYWVTKADTNSVMFDVYRYEEISQQWVPAGITKSEDGVYATLNVKSQMQKYLPSSFTEHETYLDYDKCNDDFITARVAEFAEKVGDYFAKKDIEFFMCFAKLIAGTDNRAKNTYLWCFDATSPIRAMQDDLDTIFPIDNQGQLTKPYYIEEHDYDDTLHKNYWNGEDNVLYNLMEAAFSNELVSMMRDIMSKMANIGGSLMGFWEKYFLSTCQYFPAVAYNEFARIGYEAAHYQMTLGNYTNDTDPITQSLGSQEEGERQWLIDRSVYMSGYAGYGIYDAGAPTSGTYSIFRSTQQVNFAFKLTTAMWLYPVVALGQSVKMSGKRCKPGDEVSVEILSDGNTQVNILGTDYLSSLGTLYDKPATGVLTIVGKRIKELVGGADNASDIRLMISGINVNSMGSLRTFDFHNVSTLEGEVDLSNNGKLEKVDLRGTKVLKVSLPQQEFLTSVKLPSTITDLRLDGQSGLTQISLDGYKNLTDVYVNQATTLVDSFTLLDTLMKNASKVSTIAIYNVDWQNVTLEQLTWLLDKQAKVSGKIAVADGVKVSATLKMRMVGLWGNVDDEKNGLFVSYEKVAITKASLSGNRYFGTVGMKTLALKTNPASGNDIVGVSWSMTKNDFALINSNTGVITVSDVGSKENDDKATVTVSVELSSGKTLEATAEVYFYAYEAQLGDYVFADGTYGSDISLSDSSPIGIIFYIEPKERKYALCVSLVDCNSSYWHWGLYPNSLSGITLGDDPSYDVYNLTRLTDIGRGYDVNDTNMRDESNTENDGFKEYTDLNTISDIGFDEITETMYDQTVGKDGVTLGEYLEKVGLHVGDKVSRGQLYTLYIIAHRDKILQDSKVNLPVPKRTSEQTLAQNLASCISSVQSSHGNNNDYQQYYYPAASFCQAFMPPIKDGETLSEPFGEGHWFLPSIGEMSRFVWYCMQGYTVGKANNIFAKAFTVDGKFVKPIDTWYWSASENYAYTAWTLAPVSGRVNNNSSKHNDYRLRPVAAFRL